MEFLDLKLLWERLPRIPSHHPSLNYSYCTYYPDLCIESDTDSDITMTDNSSASPLAQLPATDAKDLERIGGKDMREDIFSIQYPRNRYKTPPPYIPTSAPNPAFPKTPIVNSINNATTLNGDVCDPEVKQFIQNEFKKYIIRDYSVVDFISKAWNFDLSQLPPPANGDHHTLSKELIVGYWNAAPYIKALDDETRKITFDSRAEAAACHKFEQLFAETAQGLKESWATANPLHSNETQRDRFRGTFRFLQEGIVHGNYASYKPDFGYTSRKKGSEVSWETMGFFGELKKDSKRSANIVAKIPEKIDLSKLKDELSNTMPWPSNASATAARPNARKRRSPDSPIDDQEPPPKQPRSIATRSRHSVQQSVEQQTSGQVPESGKTQVAKPVAEYAGLTNHEVQAAKYLNELLSHGIRNYATGILIENEHITLWYGDRFGIVKSRSFDFISEPHYFLLMVAALCNATDRSLGFCPLLRTEPTATSYDQAVLTVPSARDIEDRYIGNQVFDVDLDEGQEIFTRYGTIGRGTTVIPVRPCEESLARFGSDKLVAKISWQHTKRNEEGNIRLIHKKLGSIFFWRRARNARQYIVDMKCSTSLAINDPNVALPRYFMSQLPEMEAEDRREFRVLVMKEYLPLQCIDTPKELQTVFHDTITGHYYAWSEVKVLHRDVSLTNIMFYRPSKDIVVGVLCDWDLSERKEAIGEDDPLSIDPDAYQSMMKRVDTPSNLLKDSASHVPGVVAAEEDSGDKAAQMRKARYRTGTGPFMALDLLASGPAPAHLYRHDLESFFWVLVYFVATHNPERHTLGFISQWVNADLGAVGHSKRDFLLELSIGDQVMSKKHPQYAKLEKTTCWPLARLFREVEVKRDLLRHLRLDYIQARIQEDHTAVKRYSREIIRLCKERDAISHKELLKYLA